MKQPIKLIFDDNQWTFAASEHIEVDLDKSIDKIFMYLKSKSS